ncbi:DNA ligase D [Bosea caraganae]|uniref:DNA ligase (ATP) n=1 Tax=Bosea caraganae TaxID=2763117 RepID=A0A370L4G2_9HYPH|nr:DNA ligase D [Bosea caraganae]RDJ22296.1 DNA ligase D [Bosea caraganae]RDJ23770.1 DNA ligase D [Bosea caraganae]
MAANLDLYRAKRDFKQTREPKGKAAARGKAQMAGGAFVIHKHAATRLHYDLRLEHDGVLWSWAVTRGPSLDPAEKRLAVHVEDHPLDYGSFEGTIPKGNYGAGAVIVWDEGQWLPEADPVRGMEKGHLAFELKGHKLAGKWHLVRLKPRRGEKRDNWLLIKVEDGFARDDEDILETAPASVKSGLTIEDVEQGRVPLAETKSRKVQDAKPAPTRKAAAAKSASTASALPAFVKPCLATLEEKPPTGETWLHEVKFDGYRTQARIEDGKVKLLTRTGLDWTNRFGKAIPSAFGALPCDAALIDGEIVVLGENGISSFSHLQEALSEERSDGMVYFGFDLLHLDGEDLRDDPLLARKERLEALLQDTPHDGPLRYSEHFIEPGQTMLRHACRMGLEGVISKRADAPYRSGRGRDWVKSKCTQRQEFVIAGYVPSKASRNQLGSLVMGYHEGGELKPAGRVGTGFSRKSAAALKAKLDAIASDVSPFQGKAGRERGIVWVKPELVAEIEFGAWTASKTLRHSAFMGLREDKPADEVVAETPRPPPKAKARQAMQNSAPKATTGIKLSKPDKVLWPDIGFTKQNLLDYYAAIWPHMAPYVVDRPLSLLRAPDGIEAHRFFQKHAMPGMSDAVSTMKDPDGGEELLFIRDFDGLAALVQLGVVEVHVWGAKIDAIETPDQVIFDLDPDPGVDVARVRDAAQTVRQRLTELGFESYLKTSGGKGFHVVMSLKPKADWTEVKEFSRDFAKAMEQAEPKLYTATLSKKARKGRIFIDYLRNGRGSTAIAPFSSRARPGAAVSMPVAWEELAKGLKPDQFRAPDLMKGLPKQDDPWAGFFEPSRSLKR